MCIPELRDIGENRDFSKTWLLEQQFNMQFCNAWWKIGVFPNNPELGNTPIIWVIYKTDNRWSHISENLQVGYVFLKMV